VVGAVEVVSEMELQVPRLELKWSSFAEAEKQSFGNSPLTATANSLS
jgi:hypothetical protein